jgi:hypothetical protein
VFRGGGLPEIVAHGENGMLWSELDELAACTTALAESPSRRTAMTTAAVRRAEDFATPRFEANLLAALAPVLS